MQAKGWMFFNVLMNRYHSNDAAAFIEQLPQEAADALAKHPSEISEPAAALCFAPQALAPIHFSWFISALQQYTVALRPFVVACLPKPQQQHLCRQLQITLPKKKQALTTQRYLLNDLAKRMQVTEALPLTFIPESTLTPLASLSKDQLVQLIDYLGLRDLAETLRPVVDNRLLQAVHRCLKPAELQLLRAYLHQRDKLKVAKLDFSKWDGQRDSLRLMYHQRGLARFAKALAGESPDLRWHIYRHLDRRRAELLEKLGNVQDPPLLTQTLRLQVVAILEFLQRQHDE